jgi:hypothetical protein
VRTIRVEHHRRCGSVALCAAASTSVTRPTSCHPCYAHQVCHQYRSVRTVANTPPKRAARPRSYGARPGVGLP